MNHKFYWIGLPICFVVLVAATFLIEKTYESSFTIAVETQQAVETNRVMTFNKPENYDLGVVRTDNMMTNYAYKEIIKSDSFIRNLMNTPVRTLKGDWEGSYYAYVTTYKKENKHNNLVWEGMPWVSIEEEAVAKALRKAIIIKIDYETRLVSISCHANDPLVSKMLADGVKEALREYVERYEREKMAVVLAHLRTLTAEAKADWEQHPTCEKEQVYKSFARQEVVYEAQMMYIPAFGVVAEPSFSYRKVAPSRWKIPLVLTLLIGISVWGWKNREKMAKFI